MKASGCNFIFIFENDPRFFFFFFILSPHLWLCGSLSSHSFHRAPILILQQLHGGFICTPKVIFDQICLVNISGCWVWPEGAPTLLSVSLSSVAALLYNKVLFGVKLSYFAPLSWKIFRAGTKPWQKKKEISSWWSASQNQLFCSVLHLPFFFFSDIIYLKTFSTTRFFSFTSSPHR